MPNVRRLLAVLSALALTISLAFAVGAPASADDTFTFVTSATTTSSSNGMTGWQGIRFTTGAVVTPRVTQLGRYIVAASTGSHLLELVQYSNKAVLASATLNTTGLSAPGFAYVTLD